MNRLQTDALSDERVASDSEPLSAQRVRKSRLQFSLRFLIVFTAIAGVVGAMSSSMHRAKFERGVVKDAQSMGGRVLYDYQHEQGTYHADREPPGPKWIRDRLGENFFARVTFVEFNQKPIQEVQPLIGGLKRLESLTLFDCDIQKIDFALSFPRLKFLRLVSCENLHDISSLEEATQLEHLDLYQCERVSNISSIVKLRQLRHLDLSETRVSDFSPLQSLSRLESLRLMDCSIADMDDVRDLMSLHELHLSDNERLEDVSALGELQQLHVVDLRSCPLLTHEQIQKLRQQLPNTTVISN